MKKEKIIVDGKKYLIVTEIDKELKNDGILLNNLDDTLDLSNLSEDILDKTVELKLDKNE